MVIGSGIGGATTALALARRGVDVLVVERGERLPREPENWSPRAVFMDRRYKPAERWLDGDGTTFRPGVHYVVGGNSKVYGASLPRFREADFGAIEHLEGTSPAWPFSYADLEPYYAEAERMYGVHGATGEDPTEPWRSTPFPFPALAHEPYVADLAAAAAASWACTQRRTAMAVDLRDGGACIRCRTCDGFPCMVGAKGDAETCALDPALATGHARLLSGTRVRRIVTDSDRATRSSHLVAEGPDGPVSITGSRFVLAAGAVNSAALLLASADERAPARARQPFRPGRPQLHDARQRAHRGGRRAPHNDVTFQKTLSVNDWYLDGGDGYPLGSMQLIGKVQGVMMKSWATRWPQLVLDQVARRSVEWLLMAEDLPSPDDRVTIDASGGIRTARAPRRSRRPSVGCTSARAACCATPATTSSPRSRSTSA